MEEEAKSSGSCDKGLLELSLDCTADNRLNIGACCSIEVWSKPRRLSRYGSEEERKNNK